MIAGDCPGWTGTKPQVTPMLAGSSCDTKLMTMMGKLRGEVLPFMLVVVGYSCVIVLKSTKPMPASRAARCICDFRSLSASSLESMDGIVAQA